MMLTAIVIAHFPRTYDFGVLKYPDSLHSQAEMGFYVKVGTLVPFLWWENWVAKRLLLEERQNWRSYLSLLKPRFPPFTYLLLLLLFLFYLRQMSFVLVKVKLHNYNSYPLLTAYFEPRTVLGALFLPQRLFTRYRNHMQ